MGGTCSKYPSTVAYGGASILKTQTLPRPLNTPELLVEQSKNPNSILSSLQGYAGVLGIIASFAGSTCACDKYQEVPICCENHQMDQVPKTLLKKLHRRGETIIDWAVDVRIYSRSVSSSYSKAYLHEVLSVDSSEGWSRGAEGGEEGFSCSCALPEHNTYIVVTTSGFYSRVLNFRWDETQNKQHKFRGFLVGNEPGLRKRGCCASRSSGCDIEFLQKTWKETWGKKKYCSTERLTRRVFGTANPELDKRIHEAVKNQVQFYNPDQFDKDANVSVFTTSKYLPAQIDEIPFADCLGLQL